MNFQIDGRDVLASAVPDSPANTIRRRLEIGPGRLLILAVSKSNFTERMSVRIRPIADEPLADKDVHLKQTLEQFMRCRTVRWPGLHGRRLAKAKVS